MRGSNFRFNISPHIEIAFNPYPLWLTNFYEVIKDIADHLFMKYFSIPKIIDIEFQGFQLHYLVCRNVFDADGGEIGKIADRAKAGEFGNCEINNITSLHRGIRDGF